MSKKRGPKERRLIPIVYREYDVEVLRTAKLIDKNTCQTRTDKLTRRNMTAHPSRVVIDQHAASDMVSDLVTNVIKRMATR